MSELSNAERERYAELDHWLVEVGAAAKEWAAGIEHHMVPAGTESLQITLERIENACQQARILVKVVTV